MTRVLVVDDKEENLYYLQALLSGHGFTVELARHGAEALVLARRALPDLVVSDLLMPVMDGYTLLRHWKADGALRLVPFIVYTATYTEEEDERLAMSLGADAFVLKPAEPEDFISRIREVQASMTAREPAQPRHPIGDERQMLEVYSEVLIRKLEEKAHQLEQTNLALERDIVERNAVAAALREREAEFHLLIETMPHIVWMARADGWHYRFNQRWFDYVGLTEEQSVGDGWLDAVHPDDRSLTIRRWRDASRHGEAYEIEFRLRRGDGSYRWMLGRALPLCDDSGAILKWFGTCTDIDDLKHVEEVARLNEHRQRELVSQLEIERAKLETAQAVARLGGWETDLATMVVSWSTQTYRIFGVPEGGVVTHEAFLSRVHPDDREKVATAFRESIEQCAAGVVEHRIVMPDGSSRVVEERWEVVPGPDGRPGRAVGTCQDIHDRRVLEEQLHWAQRLESIGQLTGGVAHDFNNLLTVILGNAESLSERLSADGANAALSKMILSAAERGAQLTQRLLAFARRQALDPRAVDVNELVTEMEAMLRRTLGEHIEIECRRGEGLWTALVDPVQLESGLLNLCINSRDAMPAGGRLTIETANVLLDDDYARQHADVRAGQYVMLAVSDTGVGIAAENLQRVFEPFFTTKGKGEGTGLGLAMVYGFCKQSGGHVNLYSEPGQGTTVRLYLPRLTGVASEAPIRQDRPEVVGGTEIVLLVEDDDLVRRFASEQLIGLGYRVILARNGAEALERLRSSEPVDLLFTDVVMPGMSGRLLAQEALKLRPALKVLYTSGYTENAIVHQGRLDPGVNLLAKPYRRDELARKIREALAAA